MSKLGCPCGNTIRDNTDGLPFKASLLKDLFCEPFSDWLISELQSYVTAAEQGSVCAWLTSRGYSEEYVSLQLDHGNVLHDHLHSKFLGFKRTAYECSVCGRLLVETVEDNLFVAYSPDTKRSNEVLSQIANTDAYLDNSVGTRSAYERLLCRTANDSNESDFVRR